MQIEEIQHHLKEHKYFINRIEHNGEKVSETLCQKLPNGDYEVLRNVNTPKGLISAYDLLMQQINNQLILPGTPICSLSDLLPVINGTVFEFYNMRERKIQQNIDLCQSVETEENELSKGRYVCKKKKPKGFLYFIVFEDSITEINEELLDDKDKERAVLIKYPKMVRTALQDDLNNQFEDLYLQEVKKYNCI